MKLTTRIKLAKNLARAGIPLMYLCMALITPIIGFDIAVVQSGFWAVMVICGLAMLKMASQMRKNYDELVRIEGYANQILKDSPNLTDEELLAGINLMLMLEVRGKI